ncbi:hypothetical protein [cf. Phormidesmis sp. LEGE 11477]|uniref:hypothetical protein n=1 Tax=cf. Phormidesmis sp. LEGE 11477 TaxID=1828680 RepID=UPI00187F95F4|nr:hypothetical protein [cf. Phormidesmis sp. LEGE 11477]MBE9063935.1 hypothetical protein [cf. Phormidesmis sp. LEGE 11477]
MSFASVRQSLGLSWFCLLSILTAGVIISVDYQIGSLQSALTNHLASTVMVAIPIALMAVWPLIAFSKRQWARGLLTVFVLSAIAFILIRVWVNTSASPTVQESLLFVAVAGSIFILISLPSALLLRRR